MGINNTIFTIESSSVKTMSKRILLSVTEQGELVLRLLCKETTAGKLACAAGISEPTLYQWLDAFLKRRFSNLDGCQETDSERQ